jgi:hypothetical protein
LRVKELIALLLKYDGDTEVSIDDDWTGIYPVEQVVVEDGMLLLR